MKELGRRKLSTMLGLLVMLGGIAAAFLTGGVSVYAREGVVASSSVLSGMGREISSYAELRSETNTNQFVLVRGRTQDDDGGGGIFIWMGEDVTDKVANDPSSGVWIAPDSAPGGEKGAWKRVFEVSDGFQPEWFGAKGDGLQDDTNAIQACVNYAFVEQLAHNVGLTSTGGISNRPAVLILFDNYNYRISSPISINSLGEFELRGGLDRTTIISDDFQDYMFKVTNRAYNVKFDGLTFVSNRVGCVDVDSKDISGSMVLFENCRFIGFRDPVTGDDYGTAVRYLNRSSSLIFRRCFFHRIKYALDQLNNDFVEFTGCWFDYASQARYENGDGYIKITKGYVRIHDCLFAGGPQHGRGGASEVAYINLGNPDYVPTGPKHPQLLISSTRIGFEKGAGSLVNYKADNRGATGNEFRSGITLRDVITAPREGKVDTINGVKESPTVRLYTLPNYLNFDNVQYSQGTALLVGAASTTDLASLRAQLPPMSYVQDYAKYGNVNSAYNFTIEGVNVPSLYVAATTDKVEYKRWAEMFGMFDYFFASNSPNSQRSVVVDTFFGSFAEVRGGLFQVLCTANVKDSAPKDAMSQMGVIVLESDGTSDSIKATWHSYIGASATSMVAGENRDIVIEPVFMVNGTEKTTITSAEAASAILRLKITEKTGGNISCSGAYVYPTRYLLKSSPYQGGIVQH